MVEEKSRRKEKSGEIFKENKNVDCFIQGKRKKKRKGHESPNFLSLDVERFLEENLSYLTSIFKLPFILIFKIKIILSNWQNSHLIENPLFSSSFQIILEGIGINFILVYILKRPPPLIEVQTFSLMESIPISSFLDPFYVPSDHGINRIQLEAQNFCQVPGNFSFLFTWAVSSVND